MVAAGDRQLERQAALYSRMGQPVSYPAFIISTFLI
jgi:hypothetical protein